MVGAIIIIAIICWLFLCAVYYSFFKASAKADARMEKIGKLMWQKPRLIDLSRRGVKHGHI